LSWLRWPVPCTTVVVNRYLCVTAGHCRCHCRCHPSRHSTTPRHLVCRCARPVPTMSCVLIASVCHVCHVWRAMCAMCAMCVQASTHVSRPSASRSCPPRALRPRSPSARPAVTPRPTAAVE
jgi:hypothetical protein